MQRGEFWWAELPAPVGPRPVVILTRDAVVNTLGSLVVAIVTRTHRGLATEVIVGRREGLPIRSCVNCDNLLTVPRERLTRFMGSCSREKADELNQAIRISLGLL